MAVPRMSRVADEAPQAAHSSASPTKAAASMSWDDWSRDGSGRMLVTSTFSPSSVQ